MLIVSLFFSSAALAQSEEDYTHRNGMEGHPMMNEGKFSHHGFWNHAEHKKHHRMKFGNAAEHFLKMKDKLGLNQNQVEELKKLRDAYRAENTVNEAKLKLDKIELRELLHEDTINSEKAEAKIREIAGLEVPIRISSAKQLAQIKTLISKEQMKKLHQRRGHVKQD
jgi:Spy/CpxP family protein refolding chaperone